MHLGGDGWQERKLRGPGTFVKLSIGVQPLNSHYRLVGADFSQD